MRTVIKDIFTALFMGAILPGLLLNAGDKLLPHDQPTEPTLQEPTEPQRRYPMHLRDRDGQVRVLDMDEYLVGVVLAEMPASFELEALKAQAVAARTYTRKAYETGGKHGDKSVCTDPGCCQAYTSPEAWIGEELDKVKLAVEATRGQVLTYEGELIEATYFSCSGGVTEDAAAVWGTDFPYLRSVESPGEEQAAYFTDTVTFTPEAFRTALGQELPGSPDTWFGPITYTAGGGISNIYICGTAYPGPKLRSLLGLRSTAFTLKAGEDWVEITTRGYGHRVGMSQYGADAMAASGSTYEEILTHYYQGAQITEIQ